MILKRLRLAFLLLVFVFLCGVSGYMLIEKWGFLDSLYMTVITIASVGYMEVHALTPAGRLFTIFLIIFGMGVLLFGISTFTAFLVEGELHEILRRRTMEKRIAKLKGHYIVCGIGGVGRHIIEELMKTERPFAAIDKDEEVCIGLIHAGILVVKGDATNSAVLKAANAEQAKGVFCSLHTDADNLLLILTAKEINPGLKVIAKAEEGESEHKMRKAGADGVVLTEFIGGLRMASEMVRPEAVTFLDKMLKSPDGAYRIEDIMVHKDSPFRDKTLKASGLLDTQGITVAAVRQGEKYIFSPAGDEVLGNGDAIILIGNIERIRAIKEISG